MLVLIRKEINSFISSITGYLIITVFLLANASFIWIFPGEFNILDNGYASLDTLFIMAPVIFLFLAPALTMRMIAEEKRTGTLELLLTKPLTELQIAFAKYIAGLCLAILSLIPTLIFFYSAYQLGSPAGNIDMGGTWGSYIGLLFLVSVYTAIGIFSSSLTDNQIVAFIIAVIISFFFYIGFESIAGMQIFGNNSDIILKLGINEHYKSLSRGVIDLRDITYFISIDALFIYLAKLVLESRKW